MGEWFSLLLLLLILALLLGWRFSGTLVHRDLVTGEIDWFGFTCAGERQ